MTYYKGFVVNGYKFHIKEHARGRTTCNSGVCVKESIFGEAELDYYGVLEEIVELNYLGVNNVFLFKCQWFDPIRGVKVDKLHSLVEIKHRSKLGSYEPFILAEQAQ